MRKEIKNEVLKDVELDKVSGGRMICTEKEEEEEGLLVGKMNPSQAVPAVTLKDSPLEDIIAGKQMKSLEFETIKVPSNATKSQL